MKPVLLPCPFCGRRAYLFEVEDWPDCRREPEIYYGIGCKTKNCFCETDKDNAYHKTPEDAIKQWNKRVRSKWRQK